MNNVVSKDVETFENEIEKNLTNKGTASETDNKEPRGTCLLETETGPVSKAGLKMFSKTETGPVLKTVFRNSCQEQKQRIKIKYMELGCGRPNSNTNVVCTRMDTLDTQKGGKMRYLKKASMMRNTNY